MRDIIESKSWAEANAEIPIVLGKDVTGKPMVTDLTKMPHVLIAGSTGSGKTVCINAIIASLLYHSGPRICALSWLTRKWWKCSCIILCLIC